MKPGIFRRMKNKLAAGLAAALLITTLVPSVVGATEAGVEIEPDVTTTVSNAVYTPPVPPPLPVLAGPLSWNLLSRVNPSYLSDLLPASVNPVSKLSQDERYWAFLAYDRENENASRVIITYQDRSTGLIRTVPVPDGDGIVAQFDMSPDGRYFAYSYTEDYYSDKARIYWHDRLTGSLELIGGTDNADEIPGFHQNLVSISADGRFVAFETKADGLVSGDTDGKRDIYLYDREAAAGSKLVRLTASLEANYGDTSFAPSLSADGGKVVFVSKSKLLSNGDDWVGTENIYLYDSQATEGAKLRRIARGNAPSMTGDGATIAFSTRESLVSSDTNGKQDIYLYHTQDQSFRRISLAPDGSEHPWDSSNPSLSRNGAYVAYEVEKKDGNQVQTELYVANVLGLNSTKVEVAGSNPLLKSPSNKPYVSDTGGTVSFFSFYEDRIVGVPFTMYGYFLAMNGSVPEWPADKQLTASVVGPGSVTLTWNPASDPDSLIGYVVYLNGDPVASIPASGPRTVTLNNQAWGDYNLLQVEAIDNQYRRSANGPTYELEMEHPDREASIHWLPEGLPNKFGTLNPGAQIRVRATGPAGKEAKAEYLYKEWSGATQVEKQASVALNQIQPGLYTGSITLSEAATELTSMKLVLSGEAEPIPAENDPMPVGGTLRVSFTGAAADELKDARLNLYYPGKGSVEIVLGDQGEELITGVWPGESIELALRSPDNGESMGTLTGIRIESGRTSHAAFEAFVPARAKVKVLGPSDVPIYGVPVLLRNGEGRIVGKLTTWADGETNLVYDLKRGETITAELDLQDFDYKLAPGSDLSRVLERGDNILTVHLVTPDKGTVEVTVKNPNGEPVFNAYVTASQFYKGRSHIVRGVTDLAGKIKLELYAADAEIEAEEPYYQYKSEVHKVTVTNNRNLTLEVPVKQPVRGIVNLNVFKKALDTDWQGPLNMANENFLSVITHRFGWIKTYYANAVQIGSNPGTPVEVCVSGAIHAYVRACDNVVLDDSSNATATIRLEEKGARVQGTVQTGRNISYHGSIYEIKENGSKTWVGNAYDANFQTTPFNVNVPRGGNFRMELSRTIRDADYRTRYEYANVDFTVNEGQVKQLGSISFSATSRFAGKSGNSFMALNPFVIPGKFVTLRAAYRNNQEETAANAVLLLDIPEGMSLVTDGAGNMAVTGGLGGTAPVVEGRTLKVALGDLAKGASGVVTYKLTVDPGYAGKEASAAARIQTQLGNSLIQETIGTVYLETPKVTLDAPQRISNTNRELVLSGYAPANSTVALYDSEKRIGTAVANSLGIWKSGVVTLIDLGEPKLLDLGKPSLHALNAVVESNGVTLQSGKVYVEYHQGGPQLLEMAFAQIPEGRWVSVKPDEKPADSVYTVIPGKPFRFDFKFSNVDKVENVRVYLDGQEGDPILATRVGDLFQAIVPTSQGALGGIYVDYDVKQEPLNYRVEIGPDIEEIRKSFPPGLRDFEVVSKTPFEKIDGKYSGTVKLNFPQLDNMKMTVTLSVNPESSFKPTTEERELALLSGVSAIQKGYEVVEEDQSLSITMKGYMPRYLVDEKEENASMAARSITYWMTRASTTAEQWGSTAEYALEIKADVDSVHGPIKGFKDQYDGYKGFADKINKIMYKVESSGMDCIAEMPNTAKEAGQALGAVIIGEVAKTALGAWTGAMGLTGPGAVVAGFASGVVSSKIDSYVDSKIDAVGSGFNECNDTDKKRKLRKIANPKWIYDPSGYVYEAVKSNPLEGVTATVEYKDPNTGVWTVWNAAEYNQVNPQTTDKQGKYGWDVPPGKWRVVWTKEGYEPRYSSELDVPPPHTEVNYGLISRAAPEVASVSAVVAGSGSYVEVVFSKYMRVLDLPQEAVVVKTDGGETLKGTVSFLNQEDSAEKAGEKLSRTVRVSLEQALTPGTAYQVSLDNANFTSYAGTPLPEAQAGVRTVTAVEEDRTGPAVVSSKVESGGQVVRLTFNEPIAHAADAAKFQLVGSRVAVKTATALTGRTSSETTELVLTLDGTVTTNVGMRLLAGAVTDVNGNGSAEATVSLSAVPAALLSGLAVGGASLSPAFQSAVSDYSVVLPANATELAVTATAAEAGSKLMINGEVAVSGISKTVVIPESKRIQIVVESGGGLANRVYTIEVKAQVPGGGGGPGPSPTPKDPLDLTAGAVVEKKTTADGGIHIEASISKEAVDAALKDGKKGKELFIEIKESSAPAVSLKLPAAAFRQMADAKAGLTLVSGLMKARLEPEGLSMEGVPDSAVIRLTVAQAGKSTTEAARAAALGQSGGLQLGATPVRLQLEALEGSRIYEIAAAKKGAVQGELAVLAGAGSEVYRFDEASGVWTYVKSKKGASGEALVFDASSPGYYAVMSFVSPFGDLADHWSAKDVDWIARRLLVNGVSADRFNPEGSVTRAEFAAILVRALGLPTSGAGVDPAKGFADVAQGAWYYEEVLAAASAGLVNGLSSGAFAPEETITREQMAVMMVRAMSYLKLPVDSGNGKGLESFSDGASVQDWAQEAVAAALKAGLMQGVTDSAFEPGGITTRAQAAVVLGRMLKKQE